MSNLERESELAKEFGYGTQQDYQQYHQELSQSNHQAYDDHHHNLQRISTPDTALYYSPL